MEKTKTESPATSPALAEVLGLDEINGVYIRRAKKIILPPFDTELVRSKIQNRMWTATMMKNLEMLGYTFSKDLIEGLISRQMSRVSVVAFYNNIERTVRKLKGANLTYVPMYPNFPRQVMEATDAELYINAILHYLGDMIDARIIPDYEKEERSPLIENTELEVLTLGNMYDFDQLFVDLLASKTSLSAEDRQDLEWYLGHFANSIVERVTKVPFRETLAIYVDAVLKASDVGLTLAHTLKLTPTDVLRLVTFRSEGDVSLAKNSKFKKIDRATRRFYLGAIEAYTGDIKAEMKPHIGKWVRLGEILHPGEYKNRFPLAYDAFKTIREDKRIETLNSSIEAFLDKGNWRAAGALLRNRPGMFARRLDHLIRIAERPFEVIDEFASSVVDKVPTPLLFQLIGHFRGRSTRYKQPNHRLFFIKSETVKTSIVEDKRPPIALEITDRVIHACQTALVTRLGKLPSLGNTYVDPKLDQFNIPFSMRSASPGARRVERGSRMDIPAGSTIRMFIHWTDGVTDDSNRPRIDLDLSAVTLNEKWEYLEHVSYTRLRGNATYHSGDLTSAPKPNGAAEFIDFEIQALKNTGARYVIMNVLSYTSQKFDVMEEVTAGWMIRESPQSGEIFDPRTVEERFVITGGKKTALPIIFDLKNRTAIWADMGMSIPHWSQGGINVESNMGRLLVMTKMIATMKRPTLFDLFRLHGLSRGRLVEDPKDADIIFSVEKGSHFEFEKIVGQYLV